MDWFPDDLLECTFTNWLWLSPQSPKGQRCLPKGVDMDAPDARPTFFDLERALIPHAGPSTPHSGRPGR
jgi:hypothetical protein